MRLARWHEEGGFCNIDELSAGGMTHLEMKMKEESLKPTVQVMIWRFKK